MNYQLKLKDGKTVDLSFSMYFLNRMCKMSNLGFQHIFNYLLGDVSRLEDGIANGGFFDDLEIRAQVLAAGVEAAGFAKGDFKQYTAVDGFYMLEQVPDSLTSPVWGEIGLLLIKSVIADSLPKEDKGIKKNVQRVKK